MVGGGGGGSDTGPCIAVLKKDLLCRHIERYKGVKQCRKSRLQMFQLCKKDLKLIAIDFRQVKFPLFSVKTCLSVLFGDVFIYG